jgi:hypothetical protein
MGRPPKPLGERQAEVIALRLTSVDKETVEEAARQAGLPMAVYARQVVLDRARRTVEATPHGRR